MNEVIKGKWIYINEDNDETDLSHILNTLTGCIVRSQSPMDNKNGGYDFFEAMVFIPGEHYIEGKGFVIINGGL